jgi:hypothetical protein
MARSKQSNKVATKAPAKKAAGKTTQPTKKAAPATVNIGQKVEESEAASRSAVVKAAEKKEEKKEEKKTDVEEKKTPHPATVSPYQLDKAQVTLASAAAGEGTTC